MTKKIVISFFVCLFIILIDQNERELLANEFITGGDISMLEEVEELGGKFYEDGIEKDAMEILSSNGMNYVRLRLWVDPYDSKGNPYGGGTNDLDTTISLAKRAKALGMNILLDLHYSDFWADPGTQTKPKAWQDLQYTGLKDQVYQYSKNVIESMKQENVLPDMVQVGNETTSGILWTDGKVGEGTNDFTKLAELFSAGISGIKDAVSGSEEIEIVLHLDHGGDNSLYRWWFDNITALGVDFDIIGLSYYPFWHGTMGELHYNLNDISKRYNKDVMIVETAYGFTLDDGDGLGNSFFETEESVGGYPATPEGQIQYMNDLKEIVKDIPNNRGRGIFWWEPTWIPVEGANWGTEAGKLYNSDTGLLSNPWDNQTLFDFNGNALESMSIFSDNPNHNNLVNNNDFEVDGWTNTPSDWGVWAEDSTDTNAVFVEGPGINGDYKLVHWSDEDYSVSTYQTIKNLEDGNYTLTAWVLNSGGQENAYIYAKSYGGEELQTKLPVSSSNWMKIEIDDINVTNGQCEIGIISYAQANNWVNIDNVKFFKNK
ncbi:arabinogalactan endo-1,4-beta-galactosidase [Gracilibacillus ureilyticus]|uniref:Arabinogalactan endo-beta-1,4-galactanase n=1 Tax=Gracilibacillus ureilyticus TaxID=531814 RepID=A0A1H9T0V3_9BACI|nr:glycosyl hydrolase 53 family protein [Gracilibacillus ureilyticus]SER90865.1 arabinogalactan endo-1,4-beta-galactosidase [Gracilibacillus ureilyticus]